MNSIPAEQFETIVKSASAWVVAEEQTILQTGVALTESQMADARSVGVMHPERVRLKQVAMVDLPSDPILLELAKSSGFDNGSTWARTHRYGISIRGDHWGSRHTLVHELVHTKQYEERGSIETFLRSYLSECLPPFRYPDGPLEQEARRVADKICGVQKKID